MQVEHRQAGGTPASLDRGTKYPTNRIECELQAMREDWFDERADLLLSDLRAPALEYDEAPAGRWVRLTCENWQAIRRDDESGALYTPIDPERADRRAVCITQIKSKPKPPRNTGDRWTDRLTHSARVKIENAAHYTYRMGRGFRTFVTLTLTPEWREQLKAHDAADRDTDGRESLGSWAADFMNRLQIAYQRGITLRAADGARAGRIRSHDGPLCFAWVAECPKVPDFVPAADFVGPIPHHDNPHVHVMMNWTVARKNFADWARWIETQWGKGFANLTRLKKPKSAAAYMAKAARYMGKGADGGQGLIRGNRYSISRAARAPRPRTIGTYFADWIRDAVQMMKAATERPKGLWASAYAFGARTRAVWGRVWGALKRDGWEFLPAPPDLRALRFWNTRARWEHAQREQVANWRADQIAMNDDNWRSLLRAELPAWAA